MEQNSDFIFNGKVANIEMLDLFGTTSIGYRINIDGRVYFIKKLRPELSHDKRYRDLFYKEFNTGKNICNPYIVKFFDIIDDGDELSIVMEYVNGRTIKEKIEKEPEYFKQKGNIDRFLLQLCEAMQALHKENIAYLDINPSNIIISQVSNNVKLIDFGFSLSDYNNQTAGTTSTFGAPETATNDICEIDARTDIYSIGKLLQHIEEKAEIKLPNYIRKIKKRCLYEQKAKRYNNVQEIINEIKLHKNKIRRGGIVAIAIVALTPLAIQAYDSINNYIAWKKGNISEKFEESGIYYRITNHKERTVEVTFKGRTPEEYGFEYGDGEIKIPQTVTHRGRKFRVTSIATGTFDNPETTNIIFPEGLESIKDKAFYNCRLTGSIYIPKTVTHIGEWVFNANIHIDSIVVDAENTKYDSRNGCNAIIETATNTLIAACATTVIPNDVTAIGDDAFVLYQQPTVIIPENVESIGKYAFDSSAIEYITLPQCMKSIGEYAFQHCKMLQKVNLPDSLVWIGAGAFNASGLQEIVIPNSVITVRERAFANNKNLQSVTIGSNVKYLGAYTFENCQSLSSVISHIPACELKPTGSGCFNDISKDCILYVPKGAKQTYKTTHGWNRFIRIVEM